MARTKFSELRDDVVAKPEFLDGVGRPDPDPPASSTVLGDSYAIVLVWRPQVALFVNATSFVPVLMPLAPSAGVVDRFPAAMAEAFAVLGIDPRFVAAETTKMQSAVLAMTASRQVLGVMREFVFMAEHTISTGRSDPPTCRAVGVARHTIVGPISKDDGYTPLGALQKSVAATPDG